MLVKALDDFIDRRNQVPNLASPSFESQQLPVALLHVALSNILLVLKALQKHSCGSEAVLQQFNFSNRAARGIAGF